MSRLRDVALLLLVLALVTGLASAQPVVKVSEVSSTGGVTQSTFDPSSGPDTKAPVSGKYWDALGLATTDYYNVLPFVSAPPSPQIGVGPNDILTIVNRTIARFPNPNAFVPGQPPALVPNPYNNPPTEKAALDVWLGITNLRTLCPSYAAAGGASNTICVIDNTSIRYDQMQGRFVVLFTVTDVPQRRSNFVLVVSRFAQVCGSATIPCTAGSSSPIFTPPVIAPITGGGQTGGASANWTMFLIPINLQAVGVAPTITVSAAFCANGGSPTAACTNYFPTAARFGLDNDNIILTAAVLDHSQAATVGGAPGSLTGTLASLAGQTMGPYAGTRVVSVPKLSAYTGGAGATGGVPTGAFNLGDSTGTGTLTGCTLNSTNNAIPPPLPGFGANTIVAGVCATTNPVPGTTGVNGTAVQNVPPIFWEPDNLRGRVAASFDSQVIPKGSPTPGVIVPIDYLVGTLITDHLSDPFSANLNGTELAYFVQPIVYNCPAGALLAADPIYLCGVANVGLPGVQAAQTAVLGPLRFNTASLAVVGDPAPVGQAQSISTPVAVVNARLFVGDSRPQQVIFREGLLYVARAVRLYDSNGNALGTSTVLYDILKVLHLPTTTLLASSPSATSLTLTVASSAGMVVNRTVIQIDQEKMSVAGITGNVLTVVRAFANTAAAPHLSGTTVFVSDIPTFNALGTTLPAPYTMLEANWYNGPYVPDPAGNAPGYGFYAPMFDVPANVIQNSNPTLPYSSPVSPINLFPWLEKLFVGMTTGGTANTNNLFFKNWPSLWDFRPGDDAYDTTMPYLNPATGFVYTTVVCSVPATNNVCPMIPYGTRGGASTDPNDGSLWLYGQYAKFRLSTIPGPGQWGTSVANYDLDFPTADPYGNPNQSFADVAPGSGSFRWIQIAKNVGITPLNLATVPCPTGTTPNPPIVQPPAPGTTPPPPGTPTTPGTLQCQNFVPGTVVTRSEMAHWVIASLMDDLQLNAFLAQTGGDPRITGATMFGDIQGDTNIREIEAMGRLGITTGCFVNDVQRNYCPNDPVTRGQMAVFLIRAKMRNIFPASISGAQIGPFGDNFGLFLPTAPYFTDVPTTHPYFLFIQKMRELGITIGTGTGTTYGPNDPLTRAQIATFMVRAFFL